MTSREELTAEPVIAVEDLVKDFKIRGQLGRGTTLRAVDEVSFSIGAGKSMGLVGESGSGKTTIGRIIAQLEHPTSGRVRLASEGAANRPIRRRGGSVQMIFQNPRASLNPRRTVGDILQDCLQVNGVATRRSSRKAAGALLEQVGLRASMLDRKPASFSSGQCQRIAIARALSVEPRLLIADEAVAALDVSVQAQVLNLLKAIQRERGLGMLFISHDLRSVYFACDLIAVLFKGRVVEYGTTRSVIESPAHPYTRALIDAIPKLGSSRSDVDACSPAAVHPTAVGCPFVDRCHLWLLRGRPERCLEEQPELREHAEQHLVACHFATNHIAKSSV